MSYSIHNFGSKDVTIQADVSVDPANQTVVATGAGDTPLSFTACASNGAAAGPYVADLNWQRS